ncbi:hypothetical protein SFA35_09405 [Pseudomonas sp. HR96]|uniref:hypothetical protein n=1 Tax=Pseudomonas sp. HR96 TaxID=1027966 RepID=UPI002A756EA7|nr:hypothetical protein [Pseudomonas sp. HR96]WPP01543.1 hypothetical protein SFA35_09405 [Pseudomonas sp. HR96]
MQLAADKPLSWLKRWRERVDRSHLVILLRVGVLLSLSASLQALYYQMTMPTLDNLQVFTATTELVRMANPRLYTLQVRIGDQLQSLHGGCSGYRRGEANIQGGQTVKVWRAAGEVYQLQTLAGDTYQANDQAQPCSLFATLEAASLRPKIDMWLAFGGALLAVFSLRGVLKSPRAYAG